MFKKKKQEGKLEKEFITKNKVIEKQKEYQGETRKLYELIQINIENKIKNKIEGRKLDDFEEDKELEKIEERIKRKKEELTEEKVVIEEKVEDMLKKILNVGFYPPEYIFELNMVKGQIIEIEDLIEKDPLKENNYMERTEKLEKEINEYIGLHKEAIEIVEKTKERKETRILELKEKMARDLQMGRLSELRKTIKKIKKTL